MTSKTRPTKNEVDDFGILRLQFYLVRNFWIQFSSASQTVGRFFFFAHIQSGEFIYAKNCNLSMFSPLLTLLYKFSGPVLRNFPCPNDCGRSYKHKRHLTSHMRYECIKTVHNRPFPCCYCGSSFSRRPLLKRHVLIIHKTVLE